MIVTEPAPAERRLVDAEWWRTASVYQIYPRSFADSNGDGVGDLAGVVSRLDYLASLGVDALWLSPFYPSPLADGGYDISDYRAVAPELGTLDDFDRLIEEAHQRDLRVIIDIVPNHTSIEHPWFQEALRAPVGSRARQRYIFRDGQGPLGSEPPSDWRSHFGGSAWERIGGGQWYCHLFAPEQPDLNWDDPEVQAYFTDTLRFWADRGVDGFRIDVAHALAKDLSDPLRSQNTLDQALPIDGTDPLYDRDEVHAIYRRWREVFNEYDPPKMAVAETWHPISERTFLYAQPTELGQVFDFSLLKSGWLQDLFRRVIDRTLSSNAGSGGSPTWVLSSHDVPRHASRLALPPDRDAEQWVASNGNHPRVDPAVGLRRARAATLMVLALPGSAYLYQGEELGLPEVADLPPSVLHDPIWRRTGGRLKGRDGARVPLPWRRSGPSLGFGGGGSWLPQPRWFADFSVEAEEETADSTLQLYRRALSLRRLITALASEPLEFLSPPEDPFRLHFRRGADFECVMNFGETPTDLPDGRVVVSTAPVVGGRLPEESTAWIVR